MSSKIYEGDRFVVTNGTSSGFLKANGTIDTTTYATGASSFSGSYNDLTDKPTIPTNNTQLTNGQNFISDYTVTSGDVTAHQASLSITESQISDLSHFSGSYNDLSDKPSLAPSNAEQNVQSDWNATSGDSFIQNKPSLFDGAYASLTGKPTIPSATSDLSNDSGFISSTSGDWGGTFDGQEGSYYLNYNNLSNKPTIPTAFSGDYDDLTNTPTLFDGAYNSLTGKPTLFDGAYNSLTGKPTIPTNNTELTNGANYITDYTVTSGDVTAHEDDLSIAYSQLTGTPSLFDGQYGSLTGKPTIPAEIEDLSNVSSGASGSDLLSYNSSGFGSWQPKSLGELGISTFSGSYTDLSNKPTIPTATSDLSNDSGFLTSGSVVTLSGTQTISGSKTFSANTTFNGTVGNLGTEQGWSFDDSNTTRQTLKINADAFRLYFDGTGGQNETFYVSQTGEARFRVNGSSKHLFQTDGDAHHDGDVVAYSTAISDSRRKYDIETIEDATETVNQLRGVSYKWLKGHRKDQQEIGVIAQEVEEVLPFLVREKTLMDGETVKTVDYEKLIGLLIEDSKQKDIRIAKLEKLIK